MKKLIFISLFSVCWYVSSGQTKGQTDVGVKAGANVATFAGEAAEDQDVSSRTAVNAGIIMRYFLMSNMAFQAELLYGGHGGKERFSNQLSTYRFASVFLPLLINYYIGNFFLTGGPTLSYLMTAQVKNSGGTFNHLDNYKRFNFALAFGLGYMLTNTFGIDARYNFGLNDILKNNTGAALHNNILMISIFLLLSRK